VKIPYRLGDVVSVKFQYIGGEFTGTAKIVDRVLGAEWDENRGRLVKSDKFIYVSPPAFEILSVDPSTQPNRGLSVGNRIWGSWSDVIGICEEVK
jgi:hypothetical protein